MVLMSCMVSDKEDTTLTGDAGIVLDTDAGAYLNHVEDFDNYAKLEGTPNIPIETKAYGNWISAGEMDTNTPIAVMIYPYHTVSHTVRLDSDGKLKYQRYTLATNLPDGAEIEIPGQAGSTTTVAATITSGFLTANDMNRVWRINATTGQVEYISYKYLGGVTTWAASWTPMPCLGQTDKKIGAANIYENSENSLGTFLFTRGINDGAVYYTRIEHDTTGTNCVFRYLGGTTLHGIEGMYSYSYAMAMKNATEQPLPDGGHFHYYGAYTSIHAFAIGLDGTIYRNRITYQAGNNLPIWSGWIRISDKTVKNISALNVRNCNYCVIAKDYNSVISEMCTTDGNCPPDGNSLTNTEPVTYGPWNQIASGASIAQITGNSNCSSSSNSYPQLCNFPGWTTKKRVYLGYFGYPGYFQLGLETY